MNGPKVGPRDKFPLMAEINMIPLIDVSLVLLIIFMVVTPFLVSTQIKLNLPKAAAAVPGEAEPIKIQITARGSYSIDGNSLPAGDLTQVLRQKLAEKKTTVLIESDARVEFDAVVKAMDAAKVAGAEKMGVAVAPPDKK